MTSEKTVRYTAAVYPAFEDLKQASIQLAGLLVLDKRDPQLRRSAEEAVARALDGLNVAVPPPAQVHHERLLSAAASLKAALLTKADPLPHLKHAQFDLRAASRSLPGFLMVDLKHACFHSHA